MAITTPDSAPVWMPVHVGHAHAQATAAKVDGSTASKRKKKASGHQQGQAPGKPTAKSANSSTAHSVPKRAAVGKHVAVGKHGAGLKEPSGSATKPPSRAQHQRPHTSTKKGSGSRAATTRANEDAALARLSDDAYLKYFARTYHVTIQAGEHGTISNSGSSRRLIFMVRNGSEYKVWLKDRPESDGRGNTTKEALEHLQGQQAWKDLTKK